MIVDNYSDTEIFSSSFIKSLKLISLKVISPSFQLYGLKSVMGVTVSFPLLRLTVLLGSNTTDSSGCDLSVTFTLPCMRAVENSFSL